MQSRIPKSRYHVFTRGPGDRKRDVHPLASLYGEQSTIVRARRDPNARLSFVHPALAGREFFGESFPSLGAALAGDSEAHSWLTDWFSWDKSERTDARAEADFLVPPEAARAFLLPRPGNRHQVDVLIKGTGLVEKFVRRNKLRFASRGFNGAVELSACDRDAVNTELLTQAGVKTALPLAAMNKGRTATFHGHHEWTANYARAFGDQTRLSNLAELSRSQRKAAIDRAMAYLRTQEGDAAPRTYEDYFWYMTDLAAKHAAIYQAIGFTQDSLHWGQMTLVGEMVDFEMGTFVKPTSKGEDKTIYPWFRYERQPILFANMLYRTHSVKAEPEPVRLPRSSKTFQAQESLFGFIRSFAPRAAAAIEAGDPERRFWEQYDAIFARFDERAFQKEVLSRHGEFYDWTPDRVLAHLPDGLRQTAQKHYERRLNALRSQFESDKPTSESRGPASIHKQLLFAETLHTLGAKRYARLLDCEPRGPWTGRAGDFLNATEPQGHDDLTWRPMDIRSRSR
jgi:hypothetical protein